MALRVAVLGEYPLDPQRIAGGVEAAMVPLLSGLAACGDLEMHVVTCLPGVRDHLSMTTSGQALHVLQRHRGGRMTFHVRDAAGLRGALARIVPDVVHAQGMGIYAHAAVGFGAPHVVTAHGIFSREARFAHGLAGALRGMIDSAYERYCVRRVRNLIAISPYVEAELAPHGSFQRVYCIENPVDDRYFAKASAPQEPATLLYAGRVIARKGLMDLIAAMAKLRKRHPEVRLRIAGETESDAVYVIGCRSLITAHGLEDVVEFLGALSIDEMIEEYSRCTVLVLPSYQETAPVVVAEAMAVGRAVVATRVCGLPYMIEDGVTGTLFEAGDVAELERVLAELLANPTERQTMEGEARKRADRRYRAATVAEMTRRVYLELVS